MATADIHTSETSEDIQPNMVKRTWCFFQTRMNPSVSNCCMALLGSVPELGNWDIYSPLAATYDKDRGVWRVLVELPIRHAIEYKWIIYNPHTGNTVSYEPGINRRIRVDRQPLWIRDEEKGVQNIRAMNQDKVANLMLYSRSEGSTEDSREVPGQTMSGKAIGNQSNIGQRTSGDDSTDATGPKSHWNDVFSRNKDRILTVGLIAGVSVAVVVLYSKFFRK